MKRHDTHLLSDESEKERKEEDAHQYNYSNSKNSSSYSEEKLISKESDHYIPSNLNFINQNNNIDINNYGDKNVSIISSKDLEDIFYNEEIKNIPKKKKPKKIKNKYFIKLRKIKLNNDNKDEIIDNCLTYNLTLRNDLIDKKINKNIKNNNDRNCISLNDLDKNINNKTFDRSKLKKSNKLENIKEKEILYFFYNDDTEGSQKLKSVINIINKQKLQKLQISNNNFSIKTKKKRIKKNKLPLIDKDKNKKNIDFENLDKEVRLRKINYSRKVYRLNSSKYRKGNQLILNKNKKLILKSNNSSNITLKNQLGKTPNHSTFLKPKKSNERIDLLFNLYCGNPNPKQSQNTNQSKEKKKTQRVRSTESLIIENKQKESAWVRMNNYQEKNKYIQIHNNEKYNRSLITKLYKIQTGDNSTNSYNMHFGNNDNCPLCQAIEQKNEENIKKMGIFPMIPNLGNNENPQNSWQNRRVYSALSRILSKNHKINLYEYEYPHDNNNSKNKSRSKSKNRSISKDNKSKISSLNKNMFNTNRNKDELKKISNNSIRKLSINRPNYHQSNYSTTNKFLSTKNQSIKFN